MSTRHEVIVVGGGLAGQIWQHSRGSALLGWVKDDADYLSRQIGDFQAALPPRRPQRHPI